MQVSVETTQGLQRRMTVQVPSEQVDKEVESRLRSLGGRVRLDGFRPGKVPFKVLQSRYGGQVRSEVLGEVLQKTYSEAVSQEKLRPAGAPEIDPKQIDAGQDIEYVATFEVLPEFELQGAEGMSLERPLVEVGETEIDDVVENLRKQNTTYTAAERAAADQDKVTIDFVGEIDGKGFTGNAGTDVPVIIGSGQMPPEFEEGLVGVKAGDEKAVDYAFPENFPDKEVADKKAIFKVQVKSVEAPQMPALDDEFAAAVGVAEGGVAALRSKIKESLEQQRDQAIRAQLKQQVMSKLIEANKIEVPQALIDGEIDFLRNQAKARMTQAGQPGAEPDLPAALFEDEARRRVALGLVINEVIRKQAIKLDQDKLRQKLEEIASGYDDPQQVIRYYAQNRKLLEGVEVAVLEDQVVDWVVEQATVTDKSTSFKSLMGGETAAEQNEG